MHLKTPKDLHYPITVTKLHCQLNDDIQQHAPIFDYVYKSTVLESSEEDKEAKPVERTFSSTFESHLTGRITQWFLQIGTTVARPGARIAEVEEACDHAVQFGGMCANCGEDMTTVAYNTVEADTSRATVNTVHGHTTLLISEAEASKSDEEAKRRLLSSRKLSLVVDLDQTVIQATIEATIAAWQSDPDNPNYHALTDVQSFQLSCDNYIYFIKPRPGLAEFLEAMHKHYEMHIYTHATRDYAEGVARIIDPTRKYFADRILSRDESGNKTYKSLKRLFPVGTHMVVIIDDRGDVWHWINNLIRVKPFDFFVGVGDINSAFLPKHAGFGASSPSTSITGSPASPSALTETTIDDVAYPDLGDPRPDTGTGIESSAAVLDQLIAEQDDSPQALTEQTQETDEKLAAQAAERPMLQRQRILDEADDAAEAVETTQAELPAVQMSVEGSAVVAGSPSHSSPRSRPRHSLLHNDDDELVYLQQGLQRIHQAWFDKYDRSMSNVRGSRVAELRPGHTDRAAPDGPDSIPDVADIMKQIKTDVLRGTHLVLTGVVPTFGTDIRQHQLSLWATSHGAIITNDLTPQTTHVIAHVSRKTVKVRKAAKYKDRIRIVSLDWLEACIRRLEHVDETPYLLHQNVSPFASNSPSPSSHTPPEVDLQDGLSNAADHDGRKLTALNGVLVTPSTDGDETDLEELEAYMPSLSREESSPERETKEDWATFDDELEAFLDEASESEAESVASQSDNESRSGDRKRKLADITVESPTDGEESDATTLGSKLQRRKRKALARVSSLSSAVTTPVEGPSANGLDSAGPEQASPGKNVATEEADESDEGDLEAELEAEMLRQEELESGGNAG